MITRHDLQDWAEEHGVQLTAEALVELLALASEPLPAEPAESVLRDLALLGLYPTAAMSDALRAVSRQEVTDQQTKAFAGYQDSDPETVWYEAIPSPPWDGEFEALRALATDLIALRSACRLLPPLVRVAIQARRLAIHDHAADSREGLDACFELRVLEDALDAVGLPLTMLWHDRDVDGPGSRR